jgi:uncharacterized tellurite resistance protein B-like protein
MLDVIKQFFSAELAPTEETMEQQLQLAAAALLIELSYADFSSDGVEIEAIEQTLRKTFTLDEDKLTALVAMAHEETKDATSLYQFTRLINDHYSPEQKYELIKTLWQVAIADGEISKYEDHLIRKIAELIYVSHSHFIRAKLDVLG